MKKRHERETNLNRDKKGNRFYKLGATHQAGWGFEQLV